MCSNIIFAASSLAFGSLWLEGCGGGANDAFLSDEGASEMDRRTQAHCNNCFKLSPQVTDYWCRSNCKADFRAHKCPAHYCFQRAITTTTTTPFLVPPPTSCAPFVTCQSISTLVTNSWCKSNCVRGNPACDPASGPAHHTCSCSAHSAPQCDLEVVQFDFLRATEKENDLANGGRLVFGGLGSIGGRPFDLQVSALNEYKTNKAGRNGLLGKSGQINVKHGETANLEFTFVDSESQLQVELRAFYFSIFDIDRPGSSSTEIIEVNGFEEIIFPANKEYEVEDKSDGGKLVTATKRGSFCDNALDPGKLEIVECRGRTIDQAARSFVMLFKKTSSFEITFRVPGESLDYGRNFQFSGWSALVAPCLHCTTQWTQIVTDGRVTNAWCNQNCIGAGNELHPACDVSSGEHQFCGCQADNVPAPPPAQLPVPDAGHCDTEWQPQRSTVTSQWCSNNCVGAGNELHPACDDVSGVHQHCKCVTLDECAENTVMLAFSGKQVVENNLGGYGDGGQEERLVLKNVGQVNGQDVSMIVKVTNTDYKPQFNRIGDNTNFKGETVYINVKSGSRAVLKFSFVDSIDLEQNNLETFVQLPAFYTTILDVDGYEVDNELVQTEVVKVTGYDEIITPKIKDYTAVESVVDGVDTLTVTALKPGSGCDNPRDPAKLEVVQCNGRTVSQRARTFTMLFKNTFQYQMTFEAPSSDASSGGRNFAFSGWASLVQACPAPTPTPTPAPTPEESPSCSCDASKLTDGSEECTDKELFVWRDELRDPQPVEGNWAVQQSTAFATGGCMAYVRTNGGTCNDFCAAQDQVCTRGMDDAHHQSDWLFGNDETKCSIFPGGHSRKTQDDAGCNQKWQTQFCACGCSVPSRIFLDNCDVLQDHGPFRACNVGFANPANPVDTARDPVDMIFVIRDSLGNSCGVLGTDDNGNLLVSTVGCAQSQFITPEYVVPGGLKVVSFQTSFKFQVKFLGPQAAVPVTFEAKLGKFEAKPGKNYRIELSATSNLISATF